MGSRSGTNKGGYVFGADAIAETYTVERDGVKIIRLRWHFKHYKKKLKEIKTKKIKRA